MSMRVISDFAGESMIDEIVPKDSPMMRFYRDKTVFVTGSTGFLGILFVEKLLRCNVKTVYVLVRSKKNKSPIERIHETFTGVVFAKLKKLDPDYMTRIQLIQGDTCEADLGISNDDRRDIIANVEIVIHSAADVRFDKPLQELCLTNVRGTKALTTLAEQMEKLIVFAYISTAFSQFYRDEFIEEKFYPPPYDPDDMIRIAEHFEKHQTEELNFLTDKVLHPWENTYVFTKALSEEVVRRAAHKFPILVIRPSIKGNANLQRITKNTEPTFRICVAFFISTYKDPIPAWANNFYGVNGYCIGIGLGFIKVGVGSNSKKIELVCADFVTNGTLAAMWNKVNTSPHDSPCKIESVLHCREKMPPHEGSAKNRDEFSESDSVVHITSQDPVTWGELQESMISFYEQYPLMNALSVACNVLVAPGLTFLLMTVMHHVIPAVVLDAFFRITNNKMRLLPLYRKYQDFLKRTSYFLNHIWHFDHQNMKRIIENMSKTDQQYFHCDIFRFNAIDYSRDYVLGLRTYVAGDPLNEQHINAAKRRYMILRLISYVRSMFYYGVLGYLLYMFMRLCDVPYYFELMRG